MAAPIRHVRVLFLCVFLLLSWKRKASRRKNRQDNTNLVVAHNKPSFVVRSQQRIRAYMRRRDRKTLQYAMSLSAMLSSGAMGTDTLPIERSVWSYPRSEHWWSYIVTQTFTPKQWVENFRMRRETFYFLCQTLQPFLEKRDTNMRRSIAVDRKVGAVIWALATQCELRTIGHLFGISQAVLCITIKETCKAINRVLVPRLIRLPSPDEVNRIMDGFRRMWGFPNCAGAIDGTHVPILAPKLFKNDYYNRKCYHSYNVQAYVDDCYRFRDVVAGWPGSVHDARILGNSNLYDLGQSGRLFPGVTTNVNGTDVTPVILGDPAYPLLPWLMKPYPDNAATTQAQKQFNYMQSRNRMVVENTFGLLKGRWRRLLKRSDFRYLDVPDIVLTCCALHNLCQDEGEEFPAYWHEEVAARIEELRVPVPAIDHEDMDGNATRLRVTLTQYFVH